MAERASLETTKSRLRIPAPPGDCSGPCCGRRASPDEPSDHTQPVVRRVARLLSRISAPAAVAIKLQVSPALVPMAGHHPHHAWQGSTLAPSAGPTAVSQPPRSRPNAAGGSKRPPLQTKPRKAAALHIAGLGQAALVSFAPLPRMPRPNRRAGRRSKEYGQRLRSPRSRATRSRTLTPTVHRGTSESERPPLKD